ncbi:DUF3052 domain-containing protein [Sphingomonas mesophila]|uniref:DUF3052 domain-containing protein n=1 Tax=Sphingomonas mesophila TaxID=2303576 RepID=UPI001F0741C9|nr:DUF3052 domain-containing protein [Sphingomonas mesophila]
MTASAGYSGTPLARKLSLKTGMRLFWDGVPDSVADEIRAGLADEDATVTMLREPTAPLDAAHVFVTGRGALESWLHRLMPLLSPGGFIWVSWPKKAAKVATDVTEDVIRDVCLPMGLVDVKVCAIDATWSGLKLMRRRA